nr:hypothetical protein [Spirosoma pollinicola]
MFHTNPSLIANDLQPKRAHGEIAANSLAPRLYSVLELPDNSHLPKCNYVPDVHNAPESRRAVRMVQLELLRLALEVVLVPLLSQ